MLFLSFTIYFLSLSYCLLFLSSFVLSFLTPPCLPSLFSNQVSFCFYLLLSTFYLLSLCSFLLSSFYFPLSTVLHAYLVWISLRLDFFLISFAQSCSVTQYFFSCLSLPFSSLMPHIVDGFSFFSPPHLSFCNLSRGFSLFHPSFISSLLILTFSSISSILHASFSLILLSHSSVLSTSSCSFLHSLTCLLVSCIASLSCFL